MSNTDGEDTQPLLSNLAKLDKIASKEVSGWHEKSNKRLGEQLRDAEKELASLRDQLTNEKDHSNDLFNNLVQVQKQLKQKEDENRELFRWLKAARHGLQDTTHDLSGIDDIITKHTKNLSA